MTHTSTHTTACTCSKKSCVLKGIGALALVGAIGFLGVKAFLWDNNVIVVDMNRVKQTAQVYQSILLEQRKSEEALKIRLSVELNALKKEDQELTALKDKLAPADFRQRVDKLQLRAGALQNHYQTEANQIALATNLAIQSVQTQISEAIKQTAKAKCAKVVLLREATLYYDNAADETDTLIGILNNLVQKADYPDLTALAAPTETPAATTQEKTVSASETAADEKTAEPKATTPETK